ncbi:RHS repeat domain-containing protein [Pseudomonas aeruginosa]|nr:RHS repeat protein [Pseudomonas aeruginosa]
MSQYSAAENGSDYLSGKPDPRTGLFAKSLALGTVKGSYQTGPSFKLKLSFNPKLPSTIMASAFGYGWALGLASYTPISSGSSKGHLTLSSGQTYYIPNINAHPIQLDGYLQKDLAVTYQSDHTLLVVNKSGQRELYKAVSGDSSGNLFLSQMTSPNGRSLFFSYQWNNEVLLLNIKDDENTTLVHVDYAGSTKVTVQSRVFTLYQGGNQLIRIQGPEGYNAYFAYTVYNNQSLISKVSDTNGLYEQVTYNLGIKIPPGNTAQATVATYRRANDVTDKTIDYQAVYTFSANNYLGYPVISSPDESIDSLLHYAPAFSYSSTISELQGNGQSRTTTTTYNKFHSITQKVVSNDGGKHTLTENYTYAAVDTKDITGQPATYKQPQSYEKVWSDGVSSESERQAFTWDDYGNLKCRIDASGVVTTYDYYPSGGDGSNCPADINGFQHFLKTKVVTPAAVSDSSLPTAPTRQTDYTYISLPSYNNSASYYVVRATQQHSENDGLLKVVTNKRQYISNPTDLLTHGRLSQVTTTLHHDDGDKTSMLGLSYVLVDNTRVRTDIVNTGFDDLVRKERFEHDAYTGNILYSADITESDTSPSVTLDFTYDINGRITSKIACKETVYEAAEYYKYTSCNMAQESTFTVPVSNRAKTTTDRFGVISQSILDWTGQTLAWYVQDADGIVSDDASKLYIANQTQYDPLGVTQSSTTFAYFSDGTNISATTTYAYDVWGGQSATTSANGHQEISQHNPLTRTTDSYLVTSDGIATKYSRTTYNVAGNPLTYSRLSADGSTVYSTETTEYDGLSRRVRTTDAIGHSQLTSYDTFDRALKIIRSDDSVMQVTYASHSTDSLQTAITLTDPQGIGSYTFGSRVFDSLNRVTQLVVGGRTTCYDYAPGTATPRVVSVTNPDGSYLTYTYQPEFAQAIISITSGSSEAEAAQTFSYDSATARLQSANSDIAANDFLHSTFTYTSSGQACEQTMSFALDTESGQRMISAQSALGGLPEKFSDVQGNLHVMSYDSIGRQDEYALIANDNEVPVVTVSYSYDSIGRMNSTTSTDHLSGSTQTTSVSFDEHGRESTRTLSVTLASGTVEIRTITLAYNQNDQITSRITTTDGTTVQKETYAYTEMGQLSNYTSEGIDYPDAPNDYKLTGQTFTFDYLGNIATATSRVLDGNGAPLINVATYFYDTNDQTQLQQIVNDKLPQWDITLSYDANGNVTRDEQGNTLTYNSQGQLMSVKNVSGQPIGICRYDASGIQWAEKREEDSTATLLFYLSNQLLNEINGPKISTYMNTLGCMFTDSSLPKSEVQLLGCDHQGSIVQLSDGLTVSSRVYDPYGYRK